MHVSEISAQLGWHISIYMLQPMSKMFETFSDFLSTRVKHFFVLEMIKRPPLLT